jgi:hypothetical protein
MKIQVHYKKSSSGPSEPRCYKLTKNAFLKHFVCVGHKSVSHWKKIKEGLGAYLYFYDYMRAFTANHFFLPHKNYNYTKQNHFSACAGLAIADFLAKRIDNSLYTEHYEAALQQKKLKISGERPDLLAFTKDAMFAIEAKGRKDNHGNMEKHKNQSRQGEIPVNFSVACVSYNIYKKIECKYYDPNNKDISFDKELFNNLTKKYYKGFIDFLDLGYSTFEHEGEKFYEIKISNIIKRHLDKNFNKSDKYQYEILEIYQPKLILPKNTENYAKDGMPLEWKPMKYDDNDENLYIDNDRIGLRISWENENNKTNINN